MKETVIRSFFMKSASMFTALSVTKSPSICANSHMSYDLYEFTIECLINQLIVDGFCVARAFSQCLNHSEKC